MTHAELLAVGVSWMKRRGCHAVLSERGHRLGEIPDAIGWYDGHAVVLEAKVSRADFLADEAKPHRANPHSLGRERWYLVVDGVWYPGSDDVRPWGLLEWNGRCCRVRVEPELLPTSVASVERERDILVRELRAYHAQGLTYLKGAARWGPRR